MRFKQRRVAEYSARSIIKNVFGEYDEQKIKDLKAILESESMYVQVYSKKTISNRLAYCLLLPPLLILAPFQWILYGGFGLSVNHVLGRFCLKLIGEYK